MQDKLLNDALRQIEFPEVLELIARFCFSEAGKELIMAHKPTDELFWCRREHDYISEMTNIITIDDPLPFDGLSDVRPRLFKSMVANAVLTSEELLSVSDFFRASRLVNSYFKTRQVK